MYLWDFHYRVKLSSSLYLYLDSASTSQHVIRCTPLSVLSSHGITKNHSKSRQHLATSIFSPHLHLQLLFMFHKAIATELNSVAAYIWSHTVCSESYSASDAHIWILSSFLPSTVKFTCSMTALNVPPWYSSTPTFGPHAYMTASYVQNGSLNSSTGTYHKADQDWRQFMSV